MSKIEILMIGPGDTKDVSGGIVTVINGLLGNISSKYFVNYIVTMRPVSLFKRIYIYLFAFFSIIKSLFNTNKKIAHIHMSSRTSFFRKSLIIMFLSFFNIPIIIHLHGGVFHVFYDDLSTTHKKFVKFIFKLADKTILLTNSWKEWYADTIKLPNSVVVYNGVSNYYDKNSIPISERKNTLLFLGKLGNNKGIYDLINAFKKVVNVIPDATLIVGGDGEVDKCRNLTRALNLDNNIIFSGWINEHNKLKLLNESKIYILPSYNEGLPMGILEAMSAGICTISTPVGGILEAIENNVSGVIVNPGEVDEISTAIINVLSNVELNTALGLESKKVFHNKFEIEKVTMEIEKVYHECIRG